jgi:hypothetical protein
MRRTLKLALVAGACTLTLLATTSFIGAGSSPAFSGQDRSDAQWQHSGYSLASLNGNYAFVGTYAGLVASNLGVVTFDGLGTVKGSVIVNQPNPDGSRAIVKVGLTGTYSVKGDGTGTILFAVTLPEGTVANVTEDFVITRAEARGGRLIATSIFEAQEQPSVILSGDVFVTHTLTRRPD